MKKTTIMQGLALGFLILGSLSPVWVSAEESSSSTSQSTSSTSSEASPEPLPVVTTPLMRAETKLHTAVTLQIFHEGSEAEAAMTEAYDYMDRMEQLLSTNLEGSDVYRINQAAGHEAVKVDPATLTIIKQGLETAEISGGRFDISIGAVSNLWKIGDVDARKPSDQEIQSALPKIDYHKITLDEAAQTVRLEEEGMALELGGISKGYIADGIRNILAKHWVNTAIINLGGNVIVMGTSPSSPEGWNVGVQDPDEVRGQVVGTKRVIDGTVVTSGIYERYVEVDGVRYHHILDPKTGYPVDNDLSGATIFTKVSLKADALSTTLFLLGTKDGLAFIESLDGVEAVLIDKDHGVHVTSGLKDSFQLTNEGYHLVED